MPNTVTQYYPLGGGLDVVTPALSIPPGRLIACVNFEPHFNDGYRRILGYERYDGRPRPHLQTFIGFDLVDATGLTLGTVFTGDTSGATGQVIGISGNSVGVNKTTGTFQAGETLNTSTYTIDAATTPAQRQAPDQATEEAFLLASQNDYRADIVAVPGEGPVRGAWRLRADTYAWRDNAGATAGIIHRDTPTGWTTAGITLADYVKFDGGGGGTAQALPVEGATVTGATSGASGTVHRIENWGGGTATNDATGYIVLTNVTGGPFTDGENLQVSAVTFAQANGASETYSFSAGGKYRFHNHNFFGGANSFRAYGCNGVDDAFEIDENRIVSPILIPSTADLIGQADNNAEPDGKPFDIEEHRNHLFLAFPGGRFVHSSVGRPLNFSGLLSAAEFGAGDEITGISSVAGSVLIINTDRETQGLFGNNIADWNKRLIGEQTGGKPFSAQRLDTVYTLDDLGITSAARSETFGDFASATVSQLIQPILRVLRPRLVWSSVVRTSNQIRWYFDDNSSIIMYVPQAGAANESRNTQTGQRVQFGAASYPLVFRQVYNLEDEVGTERTFFTSDDGFVYEDQVGNNFDGANIQSYIRTAFTHLGSPAFRKRFRRVDLELSSASPLTLRVASDLTYGSPEVSSGLTELETIDVPTLDIFSGGGFWDNDNWDEFFWDGQNVSTGRVQLGGTGENIGFLFFNDSATTRPFILQGLTVHYDRRRLQR